MKKSSMDAIIALVRNVYPGWSGFSDPRFMKDEVTYKQRSIMRARKLLSEPELRSLMQARQFDECLKRIERIGQANNLLWQTAPLKGDLSILFQPNLDKQEYCARFIDLLFGEGPTPERLGRYLDYVIAHDLPNKWTFPTYFLFMCFPDQEILVKPRIVRRFLKFLGSPIQVESTPTPEVYGSFRQIAHDLKDALKQYGPRDMVDIQGLIWVCVRALEGASESEKTAPAAEKKIREVSTTTRELPNGEMEPGCPFSAKTFELLAGLHAQPTREFYLAQKDNFRLQVEGPFQKLFREVGARLPAFIRVRMETEKQLFSRILKNDFGLGGAWPFYWGAFYPKGGKRIEDAQLFVWMNSERLEFGFFIGEYGSEQRKRFIRNCRENREALTTVLGDTLGDGVLVYGRREDQIGGARPSGGMPGFTWLDWLEQPGEAGIHVAAEMEKGEVLGCSADQLRDQVVLVFQRVFPLVLLATLDDPMPDIGEYLGVDDEVAEDLPTNPVYTLAQCASDTGFEEAMLERWVKAIERKGQAIIYGPPGTGKTYVAELLAKHLIGGGDGFRELVQFHPAYAYKDFVQGIRPQAGTQGELRYPVVPGRFLAFCREALARKDRCVLIIDEVNRANLSQVLGELMYLLEYREREIPLASGGMFRIPANVRVIGTMNTADRSIALVDHALRRRFAFLALYPNYGALRLYHEKHAGFDPDGLIETLREVNTQIGDRNYELGTSFFMRSDLAGHIEDIWRMEIEPYLEEYFFDRLAKAEQFRWEKVRERIAP